MEVLERVGHHPHIVTFVEHIETNTALYLVFELARGGSLANRLPLTENHVRRIMRQLAHAVEALHKVKIHHGDIKPDNILFMDTSCRRSVVCDFSMQGTSACFTLIDMC